jgi:hypothetical protein
MSRIPTARTPQSPPGPRLGVVEAMGQGWDLMKTDFWPLWVTAFLAVILPGFARLAAIVVGPPLAAGLFLVLSRRMDGQKSEIGDVFKGFSQRFKESVVAGLVPWGVQIAASILWLPLHLALAFSTMGVTAGTNGRAAPMAIPMLFCCDFGFLGLISLAALAVRMFFIFAQCAVWDMPGRGWEAAKFSVRMVWDNLGSVIGLWLLFLLIWSAAGIVGAAACCIGSYFTIPLADLWYSSTVLYLYRSWTGRSLGGSLPPAAAPAPAPGV